MLEARECMDAWIITAKAEGAYNTDPPDGEFISIEF
jgi:hypothetical protein